MSDDPCSMCDDVIDDAMPAWLLCEDGRNVGGDSFRFCRFECLTNWVNENFPVYDEGGEDESEDSDDDDAEEDSNNAESDAAE